ncbi:hypothetical protein A1O1_07800 [Capronia coronata CBS 617.96]|uniref:Zn(2)-C6 fungal-type domain-containing protein n=1 Tax=Capronia coronata CBS 617.96 TaxID=1182541 RepID=W9XWJ1_9EURO|nr:uncharacterized protein A1O1_07800 [Capronia coronata CBS 617.96]EXJ81735.1 hypothetical protein A1O1_07800 [Capronia coronata CBS 617.96]
MPSSHKERALKPAEDGRPSKSSALKKRQASVRISAACEACKKRKTKCTGGPPPCMLCESLGTECVIDLSLDMRRRAALQRTLDESKVFQGTLNSLLDGIRGGPSARLDGLFQSIRAGASSNDIANAVQSPWEDHEDQEAAREVTLGDSPEEPYLVGPIHQSKQYNIAAGRNLTREGLQSQDAEMLRNSSSRARKLKERGGSSELARLLIALRNSSLADGEELLRRFLALQFDEIVLSLSGPSSSGMISSDVVIHHTIQRSTEERSNWHPALQARSESDPSEQRTQVSSATQQTPQTSPVATMSDPVSAGGLPSSQTSATRHVSTTPTMTTDIPMASPTLALSPTVPYLAPTSYPPSSCDAMGSRDLCVAQENQSIRLRIPVHLVLPLTVNDDSYMSRTYSHYLQAAQQMLDNGVPLSSVLGSVDKVPVDLFFRPRSASDNFDCASWACEVSRSYEYDVFIRLACVFMLTSMMQWLLVPTLEMYQRVPDMMKPTPSQCMIPHIGAIETIPLPPVRDAAIHLLRDWLTPLMQARWSVNWPHDLDAAIELDPVTGARVLTSHFMAHVSEYDNWSVGPSFLDAFPEVAGQIRIHEP